jgi:acyl-CoA synthetase (NDP forming)
MPEPYRLEGLELVRTLARPKSVAIVGASGDPDSISARPLAYMRSAGYEGRLVAVNPRVDRIGDVRCVASIDDLAPGEAEVALLAVGAGRVGESLAALARRGTKAAVSIASGFEGNGEGPARREDLSRVLAAGTIRLVGPNCVGVMSPSSGTHLNFSSLLQSGGVRAGRTALITQSGALGNGIVMSLLRRGAGLGLWVSTGDEIDVGALEVLAGALADDEIHVVGLFIEALTDMDWLDRCANAIAAAGKPVVVLKAARTEAGRRAAAGHTGRVVGAADISHAVLRRLGVVEVASVGELADALVGADILRRPAGRSIAVVSVSGGSGVIAADRVRSVGMELASIERTEAAERIQASLPHTKLANPLDVPLLGQTETFGSAIVALADPGICDAVVAVESSLAHDRTDLANQLIDAARAAVLAPVVLSHLSEDDLIDESIVHELARHGIAVAPSPERAVSMIERLAPPPPDLSAVRSSVEDLEPALGFEEARAELGADLPFAVTVEIESLEQAGEQARSLGYPVVLKAAGRTVTHRTELGLVRTGITEDGLADAYAHVAAGAAAHGDGVILQAQRPRGIEMLLSVVTDPEFGLVAILRAGGILTELLDQQVVLPAVWSARERAQELADSRLGQLLGGYRGTESHDASALLSLAETLLQRMPATALAAVEMNPVIVHRTGLSIVDAVASPASPVVHEPIKEMPTP